MSRVLVTGAGGFIGRAVVTTLVARGHEVGALCSSHESAGEFRRQTAVRPVTGSLRDGVGALATEIQAFAPEACIHLAWYTEPGRYLTSPVNIACLDSTLALVRLLADAGCRHITATGSCTEYDTSKGWLGEDDATAPATLYAATKLAAHGVAAQLARDAGVSFAWARLFYLYGPFEDPRRLVPAAILALLKGNRFPSTPGEQVRDYLHVDDVASALVLVTEAAFRGVVNVSSGVPLTIASLLHAIGSALNRLELLDMGALPYRDWDPMFICGVNSRLQGLGWRPEVPLEDGIRAACRWWEGRTESV